MTQEEYNRDILLGLLGYAMPSVLERKWNRFRSLIKVELPEVRFSWEDTIGKNRFIPSV